MKNVQYIDDLGERIKSALGARRWSQADLARALGVTTKTIWKIVNGTAKDPKISIIWTISRVLDVPISFLCGETSDIPYKPEVIEKPSADLKKRGRKPKLKPSPSSPDK